MSSRPDLSDLIESLKKAAGALRVGKVRFMLGGGLGAFARGGPESDHDVDPFLRRDDADRALALEIARALREQIDWPTVRARTEESPYARAFFTLVEELEIVSEEELLPR